MDSWDVERAAQEVLAILPLLSRIVAAEVRRETGEETTVPQFRVLAHLAAEALTVSELARRRRVTLQSMGELVQTLVTRDWITRVPDPNDRRQQLLSLTEQGQRHYLRTKEQILAQIMPLIAQLSPDELAAVQVALPALHRVLMRSDEIE